MEEMIEKQVTVLIPKRHEDKFNEEIKRFDKFNIDYLEKEIDREGEVFKLFLSSITSRLIERL